MIPLLSLRSAMFLSDISSIAPVLYPIPLTGKTEDTKEMREKKREREIVCRRREREVDQSMPPIANDRETESRED